MRIIIVTDAWHPQINGVVRTLTTLQSRIEALAQIGCDLTPATSSQLKKLVEANRFKVTRVNGKKVEEKPGAKK